ncbi:CaiB/BaiF CoA transferase family protein [Castellaniella sp.]|uniref:CaiB/BaiF CoA transferase family protein n=1 Tax=Castellaniella sp. TaxID=1955812 RepID=UPI00356563EA
MELPLSGIRVLDLSQVMAGPFCTMLLGDMGADVIKVEPPGTGDQTRASMGYRLKGNDSNGFLQLNRNKRSIELDLKNDAGRGVLYELVKTSDVLVENSRPGVAQRLGFDYRTVAALNPRLVYASISGFGQTGPWSQRPGFDMIAQAMSGVMSTAGHKGGVPVRNSISIADLGAGLMALYGIQSALIGRAASGRGQYVDASLFDAALSLSIWEIAEYWSTGESPQPMGSANRMSAPYQVVHAQDGYFVIGAANQKLWLLLCDVMGRADLVDDPRFVDNISRLANREALISELENTFETDRVSHWVEKLLDVGVPCGPLYDYRQALDSDHVRARNMVMSTRHPVEGDLKLIGYPVKLSDTPQQLRRAPPLLGEHTEEILASLGFSKSDVQTLREQGVFGAAEGAAGNVHK